MAAVSATVSPYPLFQAGNVHSSGNNSRTVSNHAQPCSIQKSPANQVWKFHNGVATTFLPSSHRIHKWILRRSPMVHHVGFSFPARRLPLEIISIIILHHVCVNDGSLLATMLVCKAWDTAARLTGELWSHICLSAGLKHDRLHRGVLEWGNKQRLLAALKHSRGLPLSITDKGTSQYHVQSLIKVIEETVKTPRARALWLDSPYTISSWYTTLSASWDSSLLEEIETRNSDLIRRAVVESSRIVVFSLFGPMAREVKDPKLWRRLCTLHSWKSLDSSLSKTLHSVQTCRIST